MRTLTIHCQREDQEVRERAGHLPSDAKAKKIKSVALHMHSCLLELTQGTAPLLQFIQLLIPICAFVQNTIT